VDLEANAVIDIDRAGPRDRVALQALRDARRSRNKIRRLHHHAVRTDDMEATRRFYEDILGMPMILAMQEKLVSGAGRDTPFLHCFFEMGDGSSLAFFQFLPDAFGPANKLPQDGIDHHIAMSVPDFDEIARLKAKFDALDYPNCGINHGICYSLYVRDPNGMLIEFVADPANELEIFEAAAVKAHEELRRWNNKDYAPNVSKRDTVHYPLPTSPGEHIVKVIRGPSGGEA
jgi:glyoxylase I family protein